MTRERTASLRGENNIRGLVPVLPTPLNADETIDAGGVERLAEFVLRYPSAHVGPLRGSDGRTEKRDRERHPGSGHFRAVTTKEVKGVRNVA